MREPRKRSGASWALARGRGLLLAGAASLAGACSTDTAGLERRTPGDASVGGAGGTGPLASAGAGSSAGASGGTGGAPGATPDPASGALEIVHGIIDGGRLFACLRDAVSGEALGDDAPEPVAGVPYGGSFSLPTSRWDVSADDVEVELFVATEPAPQSCSALRTEAGGADVPVPLADAGADADAGPAPEPPFPREPEIPRPAGALRLAPGVIRAGGHYALVATGCTQPGASAGAEPCGPLDELSGARHALILAEIPGQFAAGGGFGLQFLNASRAVQRADLVLQWESQREPLRVSTDVGFAAVRPRDPARVDDEPVGLELHLRGDSRSSFTQAWLDAVQASGAGAFAPGANYLAVYVGPPPEAAPGGVSPPRFVLIRGPGQ